MLENPTCEAQLRRLLQLGMVRRHQQGGCGTVRAGLDETGYLQRSYGEYIASNIIEHHQYSAETFFIRK